RDDRRQCPRGMLCICREDFSWPKQRNLKWPLTVKGGELVGVNASEELVAHAKRLQHGEFLVGDAYTLPFGPDEFDVSVCQTLLIHLSDPLKALREMV